jgi:K+-sensing histidine kinase KdpD
LTYAEEETMQEVVQKSRFGMIEVIVKDTGVEIKEENLRKLFKLFGFLDATKELNTNGIGLGLHICEMIVEQF